MSSVQTRSNVEAHMCFSIMLKSCLSLQDYTLLFLPISVPVSLLMVHSNSISLCLHGRTLEDDLSQR